MKFKLKLFIASILLSTNLFSMGHYESFHCYFLAPKSFENHAYESFCEKTLLYLYRSMKDYFLFLNPANISDPKLVSYVTHQLEIEEADIDKFIDFYKGLLDMVNITEEEALFLNDQYNRSAVIPQIIRRMLDLIKKEDITHLARLDHKIASASKKISLSKDLRKNGITFFKEVFNPIVYSLNLGYDVKSQAEEAKSIAQSIDSEFSHFIGIFLDSLTINKFPEYAFEAEDDFNEILINKFGLKLQSPYFFPLFTTQGITFNIQKVISEWEAEIGNEGKKAYVLEPLDKIYSEHIVGHAVSDKYVELYDSENVQLLRLIEEAIKTQKITHLNIFKDEKINALIAKLILKAFQNISYEAFQKLRTNIKLLLTKDIIRHEFEHTRQEMIGKTGRTKEPKGNSLYEHNIELTAMLSQVADSDIPHFQIFEIIGAYHSRMHVHSAGASKIFKDFSVELLPEELSSELSSSASWEDTLKAVLPKIIDLEPKELKALARKLREQYFDGYEEITPILNYHIERDTFLPKQFVKAFNVSA